MGFCLYNNIAIATKYLQEYHKAKRILIVDWDIHHGNGIQKVFLSDPNVLYFSIHRYEESKFYPYETSAAHHIVGEGEAKGKNINVPWPCSGMGDSDYLHVFNNILMPVAYEFSPEIVIIAAGFDAGAGDRVGDCLVSPAGYAHMTYMLKSLAGGKLVLALEGGYDIDVASTSALACVKVLTGEDPPALESLVPSTKCVEITQKVIQTQSKYWEALQSSSLQISYLNSEISSARLLHRETLSKERSELLMDEYGLLKLPINGSNVPDLFREEVFYSGLTNATDVIVIFIHDMNNPENFSQQESDLINGVNKFVGKVLAKNWELIDINIPSLDGFQDDDKAIVDRLFMHIWNRYIRPTSTKLVFVATGYGAVSITNLITNSDIESKESYFVMIPGTEIPNVPINKSTWYKENSYVLVHPVSIELNGSDSSYGALHPYGVRTELPLNTLKRFDQQILDQIVNWIGHR
ncbi:Histone deacetylase hda1, variant 2 [Basidiobolus ranarum]